MQHHAKSDVSTHSQAKRKNDPLSYHDEIEPQSTERGSCGAGIRSSRTSSGNYAADVFADSISVAVIRLER